MGLTRRSTGHGAAEDGGSVLRPTPDTRVIALAGNPNVGKSTVFNALTGLHQHTGNWAGKTVSGAEGQCVHGGHRYTLVDTPGAYSLLAHSAEEEVARDFLCFGGADATVVVCDATCLERNLNLVLQILEVTPRVVVCLNLMDEAEKKHIRIDIPQLQDNLGVPVVATAARSGKGLDALFDAVEQVIAAPPAPTRVRYIHAIEDAVAALQPPLETSLDGRLNTRWAALRLLEGDVSLCEAMERFLGEPPTVWEEPLRDARNALAAAGLPPEKLRDAMVSCLVLHAEAMCGDAVFFDEAGYDRRDRRIDRIVTGRRTALPVMLLLLCFVFWLTIYGANYPSAWLSALLFRGQDQLTALFRQWHAPEWLHGMLVLGVYRVLAWVISVMLPPMAIFFPLFTLLEDVGYLPRIAFNLDHCFRKAHACGKQALTMCMGFGCNAAGVVGCRIIDSPRERLMAMLTNNFVPCNGRFPTLIAILTMFFVGSGSSVKAALLLTVIIVGCVLMTLAMSALLSHTLLRGVPSSFTLELPPYRRPQIGRVLVHSVLDRTLFVLGRAAAVAAPAGLILWLFANITVGDATLLAHCAAFLDPFARLMGLDGVILFAFILGFPANEIVVPIIIMAYTAQGTITELALPALHTLLIDNGWTWRTAVCTMLFSLMHWPCSTTCLTIRKESGSTRWMLVAVLLPTVAGILLCMTVTAIAALFGA